MILQELDEEYRSEKRVSGYRLKKMLREMGRDTKCCERCGKKGSRRVRITVHHKNGNSLDNQPSNLKLLCSQCHKVMDFPLHTIRREHQLTKAFGEGWDSVKES